jgi:GNAT superfamily N-acetyltransferase
VDIFQIEKASKGEESKISSIYYEANLWAQQVQEFLWDESEININEIGKWIENDELFVAKLKGEIVGAMKLQEVDRHYWPDIPEGESLFLHRLAIKRSVSSLGMSGKLINWARDYTASMGKQYLRLDTGNELVRLCAFYESKGFVKHSIFNVGTHYAARYEMKITSFME